MQRPGQVSAARMLAWLQWRVTGDRCDVGSGERSMMEGDDRLDDRGGFAHQPGVGRPRTCQLWPAGAGPSAELGLTRCLEAGR
jgi:hypothetical protein